MWSKIIYNVCMRYHSVVWNAINIIVSHDEDSVCSCGSCFLVALGHLSNFPSHAYLSHFSHPWVVLDFSVLGNSLFGDGMYSTVGELLHVSVIVLCKTG